MRLEDTSTKTFRPKHDFLVCIDSDGCAFDTMEIKHKECFCPAAINGWDMQCVSSLAREVWDFVNLYSKTRGCSRFNAILKVLDLLEERPEAKLRGFKAPEHDRFQHWVETADVVNNEGMMQFKDDPQFARAIKWSLDANKRVAEMVHGIPPFPFVRESLIALAEKADIVICSATPREALVKEWNEHGIAQYVSLLGAQEDGTKKEIIAAVKDYYKPENCLMIGDAPGDHKAACSNGILFYPIRPLDEIASWEEFFKNAMNVFFDGKYAGKVQDSYMERFDKCLPENPSWKTGDCK